MLQNVCEHIHNYFIKDSYDGVYEIADNMISLPLIDGQRFLIMGSVLNDGLYTYHDAGIKNDDDTKVAGLRDETFKGTICGLAIPPMLSSLSLEIADWVRDNAETLASPYQSESWGGYSYQKGSGESGNQISWGDIFRDRLNAYRKVSL